LSESRTKWPVKKKWFSNLLAADQVSYLEITRLEDDLLLSWLNLYEVSFPPEEKVLVSNFLTHLKDKEKSGNSRLVMLAAVHNQTDLAGIACYQVFSEFKVSMLWYLAVASRLHNHGLGAEIYQEVVRRINPTQCTALIMEVEIPELCLSLDARQLSARRIGFYRRQGAFRLGGIHYLQSVGEHLPATPMHILVHPFKPISPQIAFNLVYTITHDALTQTGELTFE
jgi:hypothetical protein